MLPRGSRTICIIHQKYLYALDLHSPIIRTDPAQHLIPRQIPTSSAGDLDRDLL